MAHFKRAVVVVFLLGSAVTRAQERPLIGDIVHGDALLKKADGVKVDGAWLNANSDDANVESLKTGTNGFAQIASDNPLDAWDALAALRAKNADINDLLLGANHVMITDTKLDDPASKRLQEQAKIKTADIVDARQVFGLYKLEAPEGSLTYVSAKDHKKRDKLKKDTKVGYVVFVKLAGFKDGGYEATFAVDKDVRLQRVEIRAPDGTAPAELNQAAQRFVGKGARGKYEDLKAGGTGKAIAELARPLSDAYLVGMESVYMYEVAERDYFAFD